MRLKTKAAAPKPPKTRRSAEARAARKQSAAEGVGTLLLTAGFTALGLVIAGPVLAVALGCLFAGAALVLVGNA